jgi:adenosylhomocysteine nucleosidase
MPADGGRVAVLAALRSESRPLIARLQDQGANDTEATGLLVLTTGQGGENARRAVETARNRGATALVSWGLAGALVSDLRAGTVVIPARVLDAGGEAHNADVDWCSDVMAALGTSAVADRRDLISVNQVLHASGDKQSAAANSGAVAVDMESAAIARAAAEAGVPFIVIRVIVDEADDTLPADIAAWVDGQGRTRVGPVLATLLRPSRWQGLKLLATRYRSARVTLNRLAERLVPLGFARPAAPVR